MNKEDIIAMARRAGAHDDGNEVRFVELRYLERFAALVRADERKRIADIIRSDKYGIGNMCSQWTSDDVADDILEGQA
jgi:hypothetical protein